MVLCENTKQITEEIQMQFLCNKELTKGFQKDSEFKYLSEAIAFTWENDIFKVFRRGRNAMKDKYVKTICKCLQRSIFRK